MTVSRFLRILHRMKCEKGKIEAVSDIGGGYKLLVMHCPKISTEARPGQFVHLLVPRLDGSVLRRPFSIYSAEDGRLSIVFKMVGKGTHAMGCLAARSEVSLVGPLGNGFSEPAPYKVPIFVAGGYGVAPLVFLARYTGVSGIVFAGGRTAGDLLCTDEFEDMGWEVVLTTNDGSKGRKGLVTEAVLARLAKSDKDVEPEFFACGPDGMLKAVSDLVIENNWTGWLSLDKHMGCGIGACLACVQKIRDEDGNVAWKRVCKDGPVFEAREIVWGDGYEA